MEDNNVIGLVIGNTIKKAKENLNDNKTVDYTDDEGFLVCGNCNTRRQFLINIPNLGINKKVASLCKCRQEEAKKEELERKVAEQKRQIEELRKTGITDNTYLKWNFDVDDNSNVKVGEATRKYAKEWQKMKQDNMGLLLYGNVGTGKTFYGACIANTLIDMGVSVLITNLPRLMTALSKNFEENKIRTLDRIPNTSLLVIDDLGIERDTSFA
jgi:DNA replication protein DnaC